MFAAEIRQQPAALRDVISAYRAPDGAAALDRLAELYRGRLTGREPGGSIVFTGMGSSLYAAEAVLPRLAAAGIEVYTREAGEWLHYGPGKLRPLGLVVAVSQSGESVETRTLAERLSGQMPVI